MDATTEERPAEESATDLISRIFSEGEEDNIDTAGDGVSAQEQDTADKDIPNVPANADKDTHSSVEDKTSKEQVPSTDDKTSETEKPSSDQDSKESAENRADDKQTVPQAEPENRTPTGPSSDEGSSVSSEPAAADTPRETPAQRRFNSANDRIRNAINARNHIEEEAAKRISESFNNTVSKDQILEHLKSKKEFKAPEELTKEDLLPIINPYTGAEEGGRIDPNTNEPFTEEGAEYFLMKYKQANAKKAKEQEKELEQDYQEFLKSKDAEVNKAARKAADDHLALESVLASHPELDLEDPDLPEHLRPIASAFWQEVVEKYTDNVFGDELLKPDFSIEKAASDFLKVNKSVIDKAIVQSYQHVYDETLNQSKAKQEQQAKKAQGAVAPSGSANHTAPDAPQDEADVLSDAILKQYRKQKGVQ